MSEDVFNEKSIAFYDIILVEFSEKYQNSFIIKLHEMLINDRKEKAEKLKNEMKHLEKNTEEILTISLDYK